MQKTNQANFEASQQNSNLRVIQPARVPKETKPPKRWQILILGLVLSLATGVALAFIVEKLDTRIDSIEQLSRHLQLPALAIIPPIARTSLARRTQTNKAITGDSSTTQTGGWFGTKRGLVKLNGQSPAAEAYRVLRTSVLLSPLGTVPKVILFTSSQPGDGKTTTAANTAVSLAQLGASVLLIDADLRTPRVHELFEVDQSPGLSTVLLGDERVENVIRPLRLPDLSVLPSGAVPSNPSELVSSHKLKQMLHEVSGLYDHVLIDSPPLINLADPLILSTLVDGVILVVDGTKTTCDVALRAREELVGVGANIFGVVLNRFSSRGKKYGGYY
jgi:capsular exopolysaccharide synthesis family protein